MAVRNITCNAVAPGFVPTDLTNALLKQMEETILKQIPLGRFGTVEDVANAIAFLVSDEASYITGQELVVDGEMVTTQRVRSSRLMLDHGVALAVFPVY